MMLRLLPLLLDLTLVVFLGSESQADRDRAEAALSLRGPHAWDALRAGRRSADPEIARRCESLLADAMTSLLATFPEVEVDAFWYDAWPAWYHTHGPQYDPERWPLRYAEMVPYLDAVGRDACPWHNYYEATRHWLRDRIEAGDDLDELRAMVDEMRQRDAVFLWRYWHREQAR